MADSQDNILVQKTLKGDTGSYGLLVDRYKNQLFNLAYHLTRNKDDAEDLAQEAFVRAYEHLAKFDQKRSFFTWLYTICTNLTINKLKKKDYYLSEKDWPDQNEINGGITLSVRSSGQLSEAEQKIEEKKKQELLDKLLEKVSAEYRVALILRYQEELSYEEIAEIQDISVSLAKVRVHRGLKKLRMYLRKMENGE